MEGSLITLVDICKKYNSTYILKDVNISIKKGESIVFVGHNGTGKSTLLKMISGLVKPTEGHIDCNPQNLLFHYIPEHFPKFNMTAQEYIEHMCRIDGLYDQQQKEHAFQLFSDFFMESMIDIPMKHLSKGSLQKVGVIQALLCQPDVLLLDEPLSGQDTDSQNVFIDKMNEFRANHTTLIMSCHENNLIRKISDTIYQIHDGRTRQVKFKEMPKEFSYQCEFLSPDFHKSISESIINHPYITNISYRSNVNGRVARITITGSLDNCNQILRLMLEESWQLLYMSDCQRDK